MKKFQITGISIKYANKTPVKNKTGTRKKTGTKNVFSFLYNAGEMNNENCKIKKGNEVNTDAKRAILR